MIDYTEFPMTVELVGGPYCGSIIKPRQESVYPASVDTPSSFTMYGVWNEETGWYDHLTIRVDGVHGSVMHHQELHDDEWRYGYCADCSASL